MVLSGDLLRGTVEKCRRRKLGGTWFKVRLKLFISVLQHHPLRLSRLENHGLLQLLKAINYLWYYLGHQSIGSTKANLFYLNAWSSSRGQFLRLKRGAFAHVRPRVCRTPVSASKRQDHVASSVLAREMADVRRLCYLLLNTTIGWL